MSRATTLHRNNRFQPYANSRFPSVPKFVRDRNPVSYTHLPRPWYDTIHEGSLSDRVGWVITHLDLKNHVDRRLHEKPDILKHVEVYRTLTEMYQAHLELTKYVKQSSGPRSRKNQAMALTDVTANSIITAATTTMSTIATPEVARILSPLLPNRRQHIVRPKTPLHRDSSPDHTTSWTPNSSRASSTHEWGRIAEEWTPWNAEELEKEADRIRGETSSEESQEDGGSLPPLDSLSLSSFEELNNDVTKEVFTGNTPPPSPPTPPAPVFADENQGDRFNLARGPRPIRLIASRGTTHSILVMEDHFPRPIPELRE